MNGKFGISSIGKSICASKRDSNIGATIVAMAKEVLVTSKALMTIAALVTVDTIAATDSGIKGE